MPPPTYPNVLEMIGNTPLMAVRRIDTGPCELFLKLENQNPGGSIKDRVGLYLIEAAERDGALKPGGDAHRGDRRQHRAGTRAGGGAEGLPAAARHPRQDEPGEDLPPEGDGRRGADDALGRQQGPPGVLPRRRRAPRARDARRLLRQPVRQPRQRAGARGDHGARRSGSRWGSALDAVVCGVGTGGTLAGLTHFFARIAPEVELVLADPAGSGLASYATPGSSRRR